jgi:hypothetical protein
MSIMRKLNRALALSIALCAVPVGSAAVADSADETVAAALEAGHNQWLREVAFVARFTLYRGSFSTKEDALAAATEQMRPSAAGLIAKLGETVRMRFVPTAPPMGTHQDDAQVWTSLPHDEVSNGLVHVNLLIPTAALPETYASVNTQVEQPLRPFQAGSATGGYLQPTFVAGSYATQPFGFGASGEHRAERQLRVVELDTDVTAVQVTWQGEPRTRRKTVEFSTAGALPVITRVTKRSTDPEDGSWDEWTTEGRSFVECPGGPVPSEVRYVGGSSEQSRPWEVVVWKSLDLGAREPQVEDFTIEVPAEVRVQGIRGFPVGAVRQLNIFELRPEHVVYGPPPAESQATSGAADWWSTAAWWIGVNVAVIAALLALYYFRRSRRGQAAT